MGEAYPELAKAQPQIEKLLKQEEEQFSITLSQGLKLFEQAVSELKDNIIPGEVVFKLYDTYGFPADLTADIARERGLDIDIEGFETAMSKQRDRSRSSSQFGTEYAVAQDTQQPTEFTGHHHPADKETAEKAKILAIYREGKFVDELKSCKSECDRR